MAIAIAVIVLVLASVVFYFRLFGKSSGWTLVIS